MFRASSTRSLALRFLLLASVGWWKGLHKDGLEGALSGANKFTTTETLLCIAAYFFLKAIGDGTLLPPETKAK